LEDRQQKKIQIEFPSNNFHDIQATKEKFTIIGKIEMHPNVAR